MRRPVAGLAAGLALALSAAAPAGADWTDPVQLSPGGEDAHSGALAMDADGDAVAAWLRFDNTRPPPINACCMRVQARVRRADGTRGKVRTLSPAGTGAGSPDVGMAADGTAVFVWTVFDGVHHRVQLRTMAPDGTLSSVRTISAPGGNAQDVGVAVAPGGNAALYWRRFDGSVFRAEARMLGPSGALSPVQTLTGAGFNAFIRPPAIAPDGSAVFPFTRDGVLFVRRRAPGGALTSSERLSAEGDSAGDVATGMDADGQAVVVWTRFVAGNNINAAAAPDFHTVQGARVDTTGKAGPVAALSAETSQSLDPDVAVAGDGDAYALWRRRVPSGIEGCCLRVEGRAFRADGSLGAREWLSPDGHSAGRPAIAFDADEDAVIGYGLLAPGGVHRATLRTRGASGVLGAPERVSPQSATADGVEVASSPTGAATALWTLFTPDSQVQLVAGP